MWGRTVGIAALLLAVGILPAAATANRNTGVVTGISGSSLQFMTKDKETHVVTINRETAYLKWITHQPWQQDNRLDSGSLTTGQCVEVEERSEGGHVAKVVRVNVDGIGTFWDPCKSLR